MTDLDYEVLAAIDSAANPRHMSSLVSSFKVPTAHMTEILDRLIKIGRVVKLKGELRFVYGSARNIKAIPKIISSHSKPLIYNVSVLGNRPGSNDYKSWPSRHMSGEAK